MNRIICRGFTSGVDSLGAMPRGRYQHWRKPVYQAPHVNPLEVGADFSHKDPSRSVRFTSRTQVDHKLEQLRLAKQVLKGLQEIREIEAVHKEGERQRLEQEKEHRRWEPEAKGKEVL